MGFENGKLVRVTLKATRTDGEVVVNTYHYDLIDTLTESNDPQALADTFRDDVRSVWASYFRSDWSIDPVVVVDEKDPQNPTAPRSSWSSGSVIAGSSASSADLLPPGSCCVVSLLTANIGRRFRGRNFYGGWITEDHQNNGTFGSAFLGLIEDLVDAIPVQPDISPPLSEATANWCVYSRTQRAADLDPYAAHITGTNIRTLVHFLRRRALYS